MFMEILYRDEPALDNNNKIIGFPANNNNNILFKSKQQMAKQIGNGVTTNFEIMVPLKYLSNFWRTHEMILINCKISPPLKSSKDYFLVPCAVADQVPTFTKNDTKHQP